MNYGYIGKLLRVDLSKRKITEQALSKELARNYLGGNGIAVKILYDELKPGIDPFSPENKVIFMTGPVTGTLVPTSSRIGVFTKSPLTGLFFDSYAGGFFASELKYAGYDGIVIEGRANTPIYLWIDDRTVELREARDIWGKTAYETQEIIREEVRDREVKVGCIGPAGENLVRVACTIFGSRAAGRGGSGAVLGSKNFKAVAVRGSNDVKVAELMKLEEFVRELFTKIRSIPELYHSLPTYGTPASIESINALGTLGTRNWQTEVFDKAEKIGGSTMKENIVIASKSCSTCPMACGKISKVKEGVYKGTITEGPEFETLFALGSMCGNYFLESIAYADRLCDELGLDTISTGAIIAFAMECYEKGILTKEDLDGLELNFGNHEAMIQMIGRIVNRQGFGNILAEGVRKAAERIGKGSEAFSLHVKGLEFAGHSPRGLKGMALGYATATRGASHHDGRATLERKGAVDRTTIKGKGKYVMDIQHMTALTDSMIICHMMERVLGIVGVNDDHLKIVNYVTGMNLNLNELTLIAERIYNVERMFNVREGVTRKDDTLPRRFLTEPIPEGPSKGMYVRVEELNAMLDEFYEVRGWDKATGIPTREKLVELGLNEIS